MDSTETELNIFNPFVKRYISNVDKSWSPRDIRKAVFKDFDGDPYVNVCMLVQKSGECTGTVVVDMPRTYLRYIRDVDKIEVRGKIRDIQITTEEIKGRRHVWKITDRGTTVTDTKARLDDYKREITFQHRLVDAGAFLTQELFNKKNDVHHVISRAYISGVEKIVVRSMTIRQAERARKLADLYPDIVYFTAGIHPKELKQEEENLKEEKLSVLEKLLQHPRCVAVGEAGLDADHRKLSVDAQMPIFRKQVDLACRHGKPLVIYDNKATTLVLGVLEEFKDRLPRVCVTTAQLSPAAEAYVEKGIYVVISGRHFSNSDIRDTKKWLQQKSDDILSGQLKLMFASEAPDNFPALLSENQQAYLKAMKLDIPIDEKIKKMVQCCAERNEPLSMQAFVEIVSTQLSLPSGTIDMLTRKHAYAFFDFSRTKHSEKTWNEPEGDPSSDSDCVKLNYFVMILPLLGVAMYFLFSCMEPVQLV